MDKVFQFGGVGSRVVVGQDRASQECESQNDFDFSAVQLVSTDDMKTALERLASFRAVQPAEKVIAFKRRSA